MSYSEVKLDLTKLSAWMTTTNATFKCHPNHVKDELKLMLEVHLAGERQKPIGVEIPTNWFEHLKAEHAPSWVKQRWPVKTRVIELSVETLYPYLKTALPAELIGGDVRVLIQGSVAETIKWTELDTEVTVQPTPIREKGPLHVAIANMPRRCRCCGYSSIQ